MKKSFRSQQKRNVTRKNDDWETHWEDYAESATSNPGQQMRFSLIMKELKRDTNQSSMQLLDIGSGQGDLLEIAAKELPNASLAGFEISLKGVKITKQKVPTATVLVVDLFSPPAATNKFQGWASHAVCSEVLEHVDNPIEFLKKIKKYLAPNAKLIITVPGGPMSLFDRHIGHRQHFSRESIKHVLINAGFEIEQIFMSGFPFFNLYRLLVIIRGKSLIEDVRKGTQGLRWILASLVMAVLRVLFKLNLSDSSLGWQVFAIARLPETGIDKSTKKLN